MRWPVKKCWAQTIKLLMLSLLTELEPFTLKLVSAWIDQSQSDHSPNTGSEVFTWLLYMLTPLWHYAAGDVRLPQVAVSPQLLDLPAVNPMKNVRPALWKPNKEQMKLQTAGRKEIKQKKREKTAREQEQGGSMHRHKASAAEQTQQWE